MKHQHQRGPLTPRFERRYGAGGMPAPAGVNTDIGLSNPSAIPGNEFLQLQNTRWRGMEIRARGGQSAINDDEIHSDGSTLHPVQFDIGAPVHLWTLGVGCPEVSATVGLHLGYYDPEQCPELQRFTYYSGATAAKGIHLASFGGEPYVSIDGELRRINLQAVQWGVEAIDIAGSGQDELLVEFPAGFTAHCMLAWEGALYIAVGDSGGNGKILKWDGITLTTDLDSIAGEPIALGVWRDNLVAGYASGYNMIQLRDFAGTWTTVTPGAGTIDTYPGRNSIVSYKDVLYIASDAAIWSYDGTTLQLAVTPTSSTIVRALAEAEGDLYYGYDVAGAAHLGSYDGSSWSHGIKNLTTDLGFTSVNGLARYRGFLAAGGTPSSSPSVVGVALVSGVTGTWEVASYGGGLEGDIDYLLVA